MKAARYYAARDIRVEEVEEKRVSKGEVKIEVEWCGICGSDMHEYVAGPILIRKPPVVMGHEFSGTVTEVGEGVTHVMPGDRVVVYPLSPCLECTSCKHGSYQLCENMIATDANRGFAEFAVVNGEFVHKIPEDMSFELGALIEPVAVVTHAVRQSQFKTGDEVAIFGAGPIGLLLTSVLKSSGASQIFVVELSEERRKQAEKFGATHTIDPVKENSVDIIKSNTNGGVKVAFEVAGVQPTFDGALSSLKPRGEVLIVALWERPLSYSPNLQLFKEKRINTSNCYANDVYPKVIKMLSNNLINLDGIITKRIHLDDIKEEGFETFLEDNKQYKILVTPKKENLR